MFINFQPISNVVGALLILVGIVMIGCIPISLLTHDDQEMTFIYSALISITLGGISWIYKFKTNATVNKREGYLIVVLSWVAVSLLCMLPYLLSGSIASVHDALFESVSGFTTTGATILGDIEALPKSILFWRSMTQWLGGMGIIVLTVALFPLLGIGGIELFVAESPGPTSDKIHPRIKDTARTLWFVYVGFTILLAVLLMIEGMDWYDAINHALTTMSTGGFSTKNNSIAHFSSPLIQYTLILFMLLAGTNFAVIYFGLTGKFKKIISNQEFKTYVSIVIIITAVITITLRYSSSFGWEESFRAVSFSTVSLITTTGFITYDYTAWGHPFIMCFFILLFSGACAGSTSGGIKIIRHIVYIKNGILEFKRVLHPRAMIRIKINKEVVPPRILTHILVFLILNIFLLVSGSILLSLMDVDFVTALGATASSLSNVGPGIGNVGPVDNYGHLPIAGKYMLGFIMICGRLELYTVLVLFTPYFWRDN